jgi:hypothetical protein
LVNKKELSSLINTTLYKVQLGYRGPYRMCNNHNTTAKSIEQINNNKKTKNSKVLKWNGIWRLRWRRRVGGARERRRGTERTSYHVFDSKN